MNNLFSESRVDSCPSLRRPRGVPAARLSGGHLGTHWIFRRYAVRSSKGSVSRIGVLAAIGSGNPPWAEKRESATILLRSIFDSVSSCLIAISDGAPTGIRTPVLTAFRGVNTAESTPRRSAISDCLPRP